MTDFHAYVGHTPNPQYFGTLGTINQWDGISGGDQVIISGGDVEPPGIQERFLQTAVNMYVTQPSASYPSQMGDPNGKPTISASAEISAKGILYDRVGESVNNGYILIFASDAQAYVTLMGGDWNVIEQKITQGELPTATITDPNTGQTTQAYNITDIDIASDARYEGSQIVQTNTQA